jgi:hypothetical protein
MKNFRYAIIVIMLLLISAPESYSYSPKGKNLGIGIMLGEPTGFTLKLWTQKDIAFAFSVGNSYLGRLRIGMDYLWHFNAFNSNVVNLYAGPGIAVGIGESGGWWYKDKNKVWYQENNEFGLGARGVMGMNIVPRNSPFEIFGEFGLMLGFLPGTYTNFEGSVGIRFYF